MQRSGAVDNFCHPTCRSWPESLRAVLGRPAREPLFSRGCELSGGPHSEAGRWHEFRTNDELVFCLRVKCGKQFQSCKFGGPAMQRGPSERYRALGTETVSQGHRRSHEVG